MISEERVFCLMRTDLEPVFGGALLQGAFAGVGPESLFGLVQHFLPRPEAEHNPAFKQIIPYQLFQYRERFFVYQRGGGVGEGRLAGRLSLGIGGHINTGDTAANGRLNPDAYHGALLREREEELICTDAVETLFLGWINDDSDPVGQVHLGAVHLCKVEENGTVCIRKNGEDIHQIGWWSAEEIAAKSERFEKWSILAVSLATNHGR